MGRTGRHEARRAAIEALYQADVRGVPPGQILDEWEAHGRAVEGFTRELVEGVSRHMAELDELIGSRSEGWPLDRMAAVDRSVLRVACHELLHRPDVPAGAAIDEAVGTVKELSTEESGAFVNGILGRIAREDVPERTRDDVPGEDPRD